MMKDEIFTVFLAGMHGVQVAMTNLIYYISKHPQVKEKLMAEIRPPLDAVKDNLSDGMTLEMIGDFDYLFMCINESLRIESPISHRIFQSVEQDTQLVFGKYNIPLRKDSPI